LRSVFVPWSVALGESERLFDELSRYTKVDGIELLDFHSQIEQASYGAARKPALRVLPPNKGLLLDLPVVKRDEFTAAARFMNEALVGKVPSNPTSGRATTTRRAPEGR
jgi:hypothetical protein